MDAGSEGIREDSPASLSSPQGQLPGVWSAGAIVQAAPTQAWQLIPCSDAGTLTPALFSSSAGPHPASSVSQPGPLLFCLDRHKFSFLDCPFCN